MKLLAFFVFLGLVATSFGAALFSSLSTGIIDSASGNVRGTPIANKPGTVQEAQKHHAYAHLFNHLSSGSPTPKA